MGKRFKPFTGMKKIGQHIRTSSQIFQVPINWIDIFSEQKLSKASESLSKPMKDVSAQDTAPSAPGHVPDAKILHLFEIFHVEKTFRRFLGIPQQYPVNVQTSILSL